MTTNPIIEVYGYYNVCIALDYTPSRQIAAYTFPAMAPGDVSISGYVLRKVQRNDKWVRRWLQVRARALDGNDARLLCFPRRG